MTGYQNLDDQELAGLLKSGNQLAFKELYNRYWDSLLDTAYKRLDAIDAAEEIVQDLFVSLYLKGADLEIKSSLEGYLKNALKYKIFDVFRSRQVHSKYVGAAIHAGEDDYETPEYLLQIKELKKKIALTTQKMPDKCREVFLMSRVENLSNKAIAEKLNISVSTVEKHISKAMGILKTDFSEYHLGAVLLMLNLFLK